MNALSTFSFAPGLALRSILRHGEPWFVAKDICDALGLSNPSQQTSKLDHDEKGISSIDTHGGTQNLVLVNESGLYSLVIQSRKPAAKTFKKWVTSEVLPSIRKTGMYMTQAVAVEAVEDPEVFLARALVVAASAGLVQGDA